MDWKSKLTSRKFWAAVASFVTLLVIAFGGNQATATQVTAIIMAGAAVVAYIVGEGLVDAAAASSVQDLPSETITTPTETITVPGAARSESKVSASDTTGAK